MSESGVADLLSPPSPTQPVTQEPSPASPAPPVDNDDAVSNKNMEVTTQLTTLPTIDRGAIIQEDEDEIVLGPEDMVNNLPNHLSPDLTFPHRSSPLTTTSGSIKTIVTAFTDSTSISTRTKAYTRSLRHRSTVLTSARSVCLAKT